MKYSIYDAVGDITYSEQNKKKSTNIWSGIGITVITLYEPKHCQTVILCTDCIDSNSERRCPH